MESNPSPSKLLQIDTSEESKIDFAKLQFRPYDDTNVVLKTGQGPFSPKLIPIQKGHSFSSSERSSDLDGFIGKN